MTLQQGRPAAQAQVPQTPPKLITDSDSITGELSTIYERLVSIGDKLHGPVPRDPGDQKAEPAPMPSVRRNVNIAHRLINDINSELARIESGI